jgi:hypothetical protein
MKYLYLTLGLVIILGAIFYVAREKMTPSETVSQTQTPTSETSCLTDSDCEAGFSCRVVGPLIAGQPVKKECVSADQVSPM